MGHVGVATLTPLPWANRGCGPLWPRLLCLWGVATPGSSFHPLRGRGQHRAAPCWGGEWGGRSPRRLGTCPLTPPWGCGMPGFPGCAPHPAWLPAFPTLIPRPRCLGPAVPADGFVALQELLALPSLAGVSEGDVRRVVETNEKQRFALRPAPSGGLQIRANQGHSLEVGGGAWLRRHGLARGRAGCGGGACSGKRQFGGGAHMGQGLSRAGGGTQGWGLAGHGRGWDLPGGRA